MTDRMERITTTQHKQARCPTCEQEGHFSYAGRQEWPAHIASAAGLPAIVELWNCPHCHSTVSDVALRPAG